MKPLNKYIDHTLLKADATPEDIINLCEEAKAYDFYSVCVNSANVAITKEVLRGSDVKVCSVVGFPLGAMGVEVKAYEAKYALEKGADEIDMVINIGKVKEGEDDYDFTRKEIKMLTDITHDYGGLLKVIIETSLLTDKEIYDITTIVAEEGADFIKTSTGFNGGGAKEKDITLMKKAIGSRETKIKASGGIRDRLAAIKMIEAGAERIGTSNGITIINDNFEKKD